MKRFVILPAKDHLYLTRSVVQQLREQADLDRLFVYDNGSTGVAAAWLAQLARSADAEVVDAAGWNLHRMWNDGVGRARAIDPHADIAVLNNDVEIGPTFLSSLSAALHADDDLWAVSPRYDDRPVDGVEHVRGTWKDGGMAGWAFVVKGEAFDHVRFDEGFTWWFGDDDFVAQIEQHGRKVGICGDTWIVHIGGGSQTLRHVPAVGALLAADRDRMLAKWDHL